MFLYKELVSILRVNFTHVGMLEVIHIPDCLQVFIFKEYKEQLTEGQNFTKI